MRHVLTAWYADLKSQGGALVLKKLTNTYQADGRDSDVGVMPGPFRISREVYVPQLENGSLHYTIMEIIAASDFDSGWAVKDLPTQPFPTATGPTAVNLTATEGVDAQRIPKSAPAGGGSWTGSGASVE